MLLSQPPPRTFTFAPDERVSFAASTLSSLQFPPQQQPDCSLTISFSSFFFPNKLIISISFFDVFCSYALTITDKPDSSCPVYFNFSKKFLQQKNRHAHLRACLQYPRGAQRSSAQKSSRMRSGSKTALERYSCKSSDSVVVPLVIRSSGRKRIRSKAGQV